MWPTDQMLAHRICLKNVVNQFKAYPLKMYPECS